MAFYHAQWKTDRHYYNMKWFILRQSLIYSINKEERNDTVELLPPRLRLQHPFGRVLGGRNTSLVDTLGVVFFPKLFQAKAFMGGCLRVIHMPLTTSWTCAALITAGRVDIRVCCGHQRCVSCCSVWSPQTLHSPAWEFRRCSGKKMTFRVKIICSKEFTESRQRRECLEVSGSVVIRAPTSGVRCYIPGASERKWHLGEGRTALTCSRH